ncbi:hypothetical protein BB14905_22678 [Bacillus sp. B14905]|nr:hypothetical protein BB14905_22678 [Bacillus sp. B14905]
MVLWKTKGGHLMMTNVKVQKWGNSQGIRISKEILAELNLLHLEEINFELSIKDGRIELRPVNNLSFLEQLFIGYDFTEKPGTVDWDDEPPTGKEFW